MRTRARKTEAEPSEKEVEQLGPRGARELVPALCERKSGVVWAPEKGAERNQTFNLMP